MYPSPLANPTDDSLQRWKRVLRLHYHFHFCSTIAIEFAIHHKLSVVFGIQISLPTMLHALKFNMLSA